jgi:hypothetical protein
MGDDLSSTVVSFSSPGLAPFSHFAVELTGLAPNAHITATATSAAVPEPGTILLLLTGAGAHLTRRKLRRETSVAGPEEVLSKRIGRVAGVLIDQLR